MTPQYQFNLGQGDPLLTSRVTSPELNFWFEDEDAGSGKVWNYFKDI